MKRILYILPSLDAGGAEKASVLIANALSARHQHSVTLFTFHSGSHFLPLVDRSVAVISNEIYNDRSKLTRIFSTYFRIPRVLYRHVTSNRYDVIISGFEIGPELPVMLLSMLLSIVGRRKNYQFISAVQNSLSSVARSNKRNRMVLRFLSQFRPVVFDDIVAVSNSAAKELGSENTSRITVIHNPVDISGIANRSRQDDDRMTETLVPYFIAVARIARQKDQLFLLRAFLSIMDEVPERLIILGRTSESDYRSELMEFIRTNGMNNRVMLMEAVQDHLPLVAKASAFLFSSEYEGLPLAVLEAMAEKKIIVSRRFLGYEDILTDENSLLVENEKEFSERMVQISRGSMSVNQRTDRAFADISQFDIPVIGRRYHELIGQHTGRRS
jgi:glycosyltransferase involved in cell wall biosynthesis